MVCTKQQEKGLRSLKPKGFKSFLFLFDRFIVIQYHLNSLVVSQFTWFKSLRTVFYTDTWIFSVYSIFLNSFIFEKKEEITLSL